jgi:hypothetical protein
MAIKLNFINLSNDQNNSQVVIFGKNLATDFSELAIAWMVIQNCGQGDNHPFTYPMLNQISASDSWGNYMPRYDAAPGQCFEVVADNSGDVLRLSPDRASSPRSIELLNALPKGACNGLIYKSGRLYALKTNIAPGQRAAFEFRPTIWIGAVSQVTQGELINSAILSQVNTEISLLGIASADIVMTGGGPGRNATPFQFSLQNVVMA